MGYSVNSILLCSRFLIPWSVSSLPSASLLPYFTCHRVSSPPFQSLYSPSPYPLPFLPLQYPPYLPCKASSLHSPVSLRKSTRAGHSQRFPVLSPPSKYSKISPNKIPQTDRETAGIFYQKRAEEMDLVSVWRIFSLPSPKYLNQL